VRVCLSTVGSCRRVIDRAGRAATLALNEIAYKEETGEVLSRGDPYGHPSHEVASLRIFGSRKSWAQRWNGLDE